MKKYDYTPREVAYAVAIGWLDAAYREETGDLEEHGSEDSKARRLRLLQQVAKLHNRLLEESGMDGVPLDENPID